MTRKQALAGTTAPKSVRRQQVLLDLAHIDLTGAEQGGQLVVHRSLADEVEHIFAEMLHLGFPVARMQPIAAFDWDDNASMAANNTSGFCYRLIAGTTLSSLHSQGAAIDINPAFNPYDSPGGQTVPPGAVYDPRQPGTLSRVAGTAGAAVIELFEAHGWRWLGERSPGADRHHFQKISFESK